MRALSKVCFLFFTYIYIYKICFETGFHNVAQDLIGLAIYPRLATGSIILCLSIPRVGIISMGCHPQIIFSF
jgi:hypothetical protein